MHLLNTETYPVSDLQSQCQLKTQTKTFEEMVRQITPKCTVLR